METCSLFTNNTIYKNNFIQDTGVLVLDKKKNNDAKEKIENIIINQKKQYSEKNILFFHGKRPKYYFFNIVFNVLKEFNLLHKLNHCDFDNKKIETFEFYDKIIEVMNLDHYVKEYTSMNLFLEPYKNGESCVQNWLMNSNADNIIDKENIPNIEKLCNVFGIDYAEMEKKMKVYVNKTLLDKICETFNFSKVEFNEIWKRFIEKTQNNEYGILEIYFVPIKHVNKYFKLCQVDGLAINSEYSDKVINDKGTDYCRLVYHHTILYDKEISNIYYKLVNDGIIKQYSENNVVVYLKDKEKLVQELVLELLYNHEEYINDNVTKYKNILNLQVRTLYYELIKNNNIRIEVINNIDEKIKNDFTNQVREFIKREIEKNESFIQKIIRNLLKYYSYLFKKNTPLFYDSKFTINDVTK